MMLGLLASLALAAAPAEVSSSPPPGAECRRLVRHPVFRNKDIPEAFRVGADPGQPFNPSDVEDMRHPLPGTRLILAGKLQNHDWFVVYEQGGFGYHLESVVWIPPSKGSAKPTDWGFGWRLQGQSAEGLCRVTRVMIETHVSASYKNY